MFWNKQILKLDQEEMISTEMCYNQEAEKMEQLRISLMEAVVELRTGWDSEAGKVFFDQFDDVWQKGMKNYAEVIKHMAKNMRIANTKYQEVIEQAQALNL